MNRIALIASVVVAGMAAAPAADWPQYMGSKQDNVSRETELADQWPAGGPKVAWKYAKLNKGIGGAVVQSGKVYIMDRIGYEKDSVLCLDLATGAKEWEVAFDAPGKWKGGYRGSRNVPAVDDEHVYVIGTMGRLHCISKKLKKSIWSVDLVTAYEAKVGRWGFCQSPTLYKDTVIVAPVGRKAGVVALDKADGKEVWKTKRVGDIAWTSPVIATIGRVDQVLMLHTRGEPRLHGIDAASGEVLWQYRDWKCANPIPSPLAIGDGRIFLTGGYGGGCVMIRVTKTGDEWKVRELFRNKNMGSQTANPALHDGQLYANCADNKNGLMCMDLDGRDKWKTGEKNREELGQLIIADGKIYSLLSEKGILRMARATPEGYKELASATVLKGRNNWAPLALSDGKLLLRGQRALVCVDVKGGE